VTAPLVSSLALITYSAHGVGAPRAEHIQAADALVNLSFSTSTKTQAVTQMAMAELPPYYGYYLLLILIPLLAAIPLLALHSLSSCHQRSGAASHPPLSPWALPVIGHLHHLDLTGVLPHRAMRDLARFLSPLMLLHLGELHIVVASFADATREVMRTHDLAFTMWPVSHTARALLSYGSLSLVFGPYGDGWRQLRRICTMELLSARHVRSFRTVCKDEVHRLLHSMVAAPAPVNLARWCRRTWPTCSCVPSSAASLGIGIHSCAC
jgi:hypothetical protein